MIEMLKSLNALLMLPTLLAISSASQLPTNDECGIIRSEQYENLEHMELNEYPWMAQILYKNRDEKTAIHKFCSAVLISHHHLVTIAHCTFPFGSRDPYSVLLGEIDVSNSRSDSDCDEAHPNICAHPPKEYKIKKITRHPQSGRDTRYNDIALLELESYVFYTEYIKPICLPSNGNTHPNSISTCALKLTNAYNPIVTGWSWKRQTSRKIKGFVPLLNVSICRDVELADSEICTSSCVGDHLPTSASALMNVNWLPTGEPKNVYLMGLLTWGHESCNDDDFSIFTNIETFEPWILETLEEYEKYIKWAMAALNL